MMVTMRRTGNTLEKEPIFEVPEHFAITTPFLAGITYFVRYSYIYQIILPGVKLCV